MATKTSSNRSQKCRMYVLKSRHPLFKEIKIAVNKWKGTTFIRQEAHYCKNGNTAQTKSRAGELAPGEDQPTRAGAQVQGPERLAGAEKKAWRCGLALPDFRT